MSGIIIESAHQRFNVGRSSSFFHLSQNIPVELIRIAGGIRFINSGYFTQDAERERSGSLLPLPVYGEPSTEKSEGPAYHSAYQGRE